MDDFTIIHKVCGQPATIRFTREDEYEWDGEDEVLYFTNRLRIDCTTCDLQTEIEPISV